VDEHALSLVRLIRQRTKRAYRLAEELWRLAAELEQLTNADTSREDTYGDHRNGHTEAPTAAARARNAAADVTRTARG
jgi:hypothetical protein